MLKYYYIIIGLALAGLLVNVSAQSVQDLPGANQLEQIAQEKTGQVQSAVEKWTGNQSLLAGGIALVVIAVLIFYFVKKIVINSILGLIGFALIQYGLGIDLPFIPSLVISTIFGLAGLGVLLVLKFLGVM